MTIKANLHRLNLGCGPHYAEGWLNLDLHTAEIVADGRRPDLVGDLRELPLENGSCSHVYMGHVIEHLGLERDVPGALAEVWRVLAPDGQLMVVAPDVARARAGWPEMLPAILPGVADGALPGMSHLWAPTEAAVLDECSKVFPLARALPVADVEEPWPVVDRVGWQLAVHCPRA